LRRGDVREQVIRKDISRVRTAGIGRAARATALVLDRDLITFARVERSVDGELEVVEHRRRNLVRVAQRRMCGIDREAGHGIREDRAASGE
jgi:hypothetical protein